MTTRTISISKGRIIPMNTSKDGTILQCDKCGQQFEDGQGISGMAPDGTFKDYDFACASELSLVGDLDGNLVAQGLIDAANVR